MKITFEPHRIGECETLDLTLPGTIISTHKPNRRLRAVDRAIEAVERTGALVRTRVADNPDAAAALELDLEILTLRAAEIAAGKPIDYAPGKLTHETPIVTFIVDIDWDGGGSSQEVRDAVDKLWATTQSANATLVISTPASPVSIPLHFRTGGVIHLAAPGYKQYAQLYTALQLRAAS